jgi:hypothetical protein
MEIVEHDATGAFFASQQAHQQKYQQQGHAQARRERRRQNAEHKQHAGDEDDLLCQSHAV